MGGLESEKGDWFCEELISVWCVDTPEQESDAVLTRHISVRGTIVSFS